MPMSALGSLRNLSDAIEIARFGDFGRPWREVVLLDDGGEFGRRPKETAGFARGKSGEPRRFEIRSRPIAGFDQADEIGW